MGVATRCIVHPESFKMQSRLHAEIAHASNATMSLRAFIWVRVRLRLHSFASTVRDRPRARMCVRTCVRTYI